MKKILLLFVMVASLMSCHKEEHPGNDNMVLIKGRIDGNRKAFGSENFPNEDRSFADATKVVVFLGERYQVIDIVNNSFSLQAPVGSAIALIFVDAANQYIGNLTVSGLNILPLVNLSDGENTVIDLSTLTLYENSVIMINYTDLVGNIYGINWEKQVLK